MALNPEGQDRVKRTIKQVASAVAGTAALTAVVVLINVFNADYASTAWGGIVVALLTVVRTYLMNKKDFSG